MKALRADRPRLWENVCENTLPKAERDTMIGTPTLTNLPGPYTWDNLSTPKTPFSFLHMITNLLEEPSRNGGARVRNLTLRGSSVLY